jgi:hypothetical protein
MEQNDLTQEIINGLSETAHDTKMSLIVAEARLRVLTKEVELYQAEVQRLSELLREKEHADHAPEATAQGVEGDVE